MPPSLCNVGTDVGKRQLGVMTHPLQILEQYTNHVAGRNVRSQRLRLLTPHMVALESIGG